MLFFKELLTWFLLFLTHLNALNPSSTSSPSSESSLGPTFAIQHVPSGLVMDASEYEVQLRPYSGATSLWTFEPLGNNTCILQNVATRKVLDVEYGPMLNHKIVTWRRHGRSNQRFIVNQDHSIVLHGVDPKNPGRLAIDVQGDKLVSSFRDGRQPSQEFLLVEAN